MTFPYRDWIPKRNGIYFCSPACGGGKYCLHSDYLAAVKMSATLAKYLGDGWEPRVFENLGWHWGVSKGKIDVRLHGNQYTVYLNARQQFVTQGTDVLETIARAKDALREHIEMLCDDYMGTLT